MKCNHCGIENKNANTFCSQCGIKLIWICECKKSNPIDALFCGKCGRKTNYPSREKHQIRQLEKNEIKKYLRKAFYSKLLRTSA